MADNNSIKAVLAKETPILVLSFGDAKIEAAGQFHSAPTAAKVPTLIFSSAISGAKYIAICVDLDAPTALAPDLGLILHWVQHDLTAREAGVLTSETKAVGSWIAPAPPAGSGPHRYVYCLYEQPDDFDPASFLEGGEATGKTARIQFDYSGFEEKAGVGNVIAGNWFSCK